LDSRRLAVSLLEEKLAVVRFKASETSANLEAMREELFLSGIAREDALKALKEKEAGHDKARDRYNRLLQETHDLATHVFEFTSGPDAFQSERNGRLMEICVRAGGTFSKSTRLPLSVQGG